MPACANDTCSRRAQPPEAPGSSQGSTVGHEPLNGGQKRPRPNRAGRNLPGPEAPTPLLANRVKLSRVVRGHLYSGRLQWRATWLLSAKQPFGLASIRARAERRGPPSWRRPPQKPRKDWRFARWQDGSVPARQSLGRRICKQRSPDSAAMTRPAGKIWARSKPHPCCPSMLGVPVGTMR